MGLPSINPGPPNRPDPEAHQLAPTCPVCAGKMDTVYSRAHTKVWVCVDCHSGLSVPTTAYDVARIKVEPES
jgi:ribosomal protein L37AE/L43A